MKSACGVSLSAVLLCASLSWGADYRVEPLKESAPADALSSEIAAQLSASGVRVIRGSKTTFCDIWLCKAWPVRENFKATPAILYPFTPGQLIGVIRFSRDGGDFRDQEIPKGVYTLRYAQQPVDGAHVGTSLTRDFLLLLRAEDDREPGVVGYDALTLKSAEAAESSHPCMLSMKEPADKAKAPAIRHRDEDDWWIVTLAGQAQAGDARKKLPFDLVVVGYIEE